MKIVDRDRIKDKVNGREQGTEKPKHWKGCLCGY